MKKIFKGKAIKGRIEPYDKEKFNLLLWSLNDKEIEITISKPRKHRSNNQNSYYWGIVIKILSGHTGYTADEMHDTLRMMFLVDRTGKIPVMKSTTSLSTVQFEEYMTNVRQFASIELGCYIPEPNEIEY